MTVRDYAVDALIAGGVAAWLSWRLHLQPTPEGWLDLALATPLLDASRARTELGWEPRHAADATFLELLSGIREGARLPTPPLSAGVP